MRILLISDKKELFDLTKKSIDSEHELIWENYVSVAGDKFLYADIVILHFTKFMLQEGILIPFVKIKVKFGDFVPILAIVEGGTPKQLFSVLQLGAYDYVDILNQSSDVFKKKIRDILMWKWYLKRYRDT